MSEDDNQTKETPEEESPVSEEEPDLSQFLPPMDIPILAQSFIHVLGSAAWQHLGLVADPRTGEVKMDLGQAQQAIDIMGFLFDKVKDSMEKEQESAVRSLLINLQMNYVEKAKE
jgi:hypothetical protein